VQKWKLIFRNECKTYYTDPEKLAGFLKKGMVDIEEFVMVAAAVETAVVDGGYKQIEPEDFDAEGISNLANDTSVFNAKRNLAAMLLGLTMKGQDNAAKVDAFIQTPSVALAVAAGFKQLQLAPLWNVSTQADVAKVKLSSLHEGANVLLNKVAISHDYWARFDNIDNVECYLATGSLALKKSGKKQTSAMKFEVMNAAEALAIHKAICGKNTSRQPTKSSGNDIDEDAEIDEDLFAL
jgi:hypothetical protein